jgi:predicted nuclease of predicted toxin-antitoxin system
VPAPASPPRLLFDENLAPGLVRRLADAFPGAVHVRELGLERASDETIWERASADGFVIVTKDDDFRQRSFLYGPPPQVIWLRLGNCSTADVERVLRARRADVVRFCADRTAALLLLSQPA